MEFLKKIILLFICVFSGVLLAGYDKINSYPLTDWVTRSHVQSAIVKCGQIFNESHLSGIDINSLDGLAVRGDGLPNLYEIRDGILIIDIQNYVEGGATLAIFRDVDRKTSDSKWFNFSSVRSYRFPFVTGAGIKMQKKIGTNRSIYYLKTTSAQFPQLIKAAGNAKVYVLGQASLNKSLEIWVKNNSKVYFQDLSSTQPVMIHAREEQSVVLAKSGSCKKIYVSSRKATVDLFGVSSEEVLVNLSFAHIGAVNVNPTQKLVKIGKKIKKGSLTVKENSGYETRELDSREYKTKRFFQQSLPRVLKKQAKGALLVGGRALQMVFNVSIILFVSGIIIIRLADTRLWPLLLFIHWDLPFMRNSPSSARQKSLIK